MEITKSGSQPSAKGPADWFTGSVRIDSPFQRPAPARIGGATVTFEPGARTAWHTHPLGQTLIVTAGCGRVQRDGGPIEEIRGGDIVWFSPGERHWHGAFRIRETERVNVDDGYDEVDCSSFGIPRNHGATTNSSGEQRLNADSSNRTA